MIHHIKPKYIHIIYSKYIYIDCTTNYIQVFVVNSLQDSSFPIYSYAPGLAIEPAVPGALETNSDYTPHTMPSCMPALMSLGKYSSGPGSFGLSCPSAVLLPGVGQMQSPPIVLLFSLLNLMILAGLGCPCLNLLNDVFYRSFPLSLGNCRGTTQRSIDGCQPLSTGSRAAWIIGNGIVYQRKCITASSQGKLHSAPCPVSQ